MPRAIEDPILAYTAAEGEINQIQWGATQPDWIGFHSNSKCWTGFNVSFDIWFVDPLSPFSHLLQQESGDPKSVSVFGTIALGLCVTDLDWLSHENISSDIGCNLCMTPYECTNKSIPFVLFSAVIRPTRIRNSSSPRAARHKNPVVAAGHPVLCSPLYTWVVLAAVALPCLMMIITTWTMSC